jgi:hypothetical protein
MPFLPILWLSALLLLGHEPRSVEARPSTWVTIENSSRGRVVDADTAPALRRIDKLVRKWGVGSKAHREILERPLPGTYAPTMYDFIDHFLVVSYHLPYSLPELGDGVEVWIDRRTGKHAVIPKVVLRRAYIAAVQAGWDLTLYRRTVERTDDLYVVRFIMAKETVMLDGEFSVLISIKTGRLAQPLLKMPLPRP